MAQFVVQQVRDFLLLGLHHGIRLRHLILELPLQKPALPLHHVVGVVAEFKLLGEGLLFVGHDQLQVLDLLVKLLDDQVLVDILAFLLLVLAVLLVATAVVGLHLLGYQSIEGVFDLLLLLPDPLFRHLGLELILVVLAFLLLVGQLFL